ncbi:MAG TPA: M56 family metallopeptidase [Thermoanaerobaculia bacterium]|nr:M56 family metallopeptidase [Thermoanaerobaculia bacterium]
MNELVTSAFGFALDLAVKATFLFALTLAAVALLRRSGAAARHFAGTAGLVGALALPLLAAALPRVSVPLLRSPIPEMASFGIAPAKDSRYPRAAEKPSLAVETRSVEKEVVETDQVRFEPAVQAPKALAARAVSAPAVPSTPVRIPWLPVSLALWVGGTLLVAARLAVGLERVRRMHREAEPLEDGDWKHDASDLARQLEVRRSVELFESRLVPVAITSGLFRPFLLLCHQARLWAVERRRVVLLHELAHVKRADWAWLLLAEAAVALYWWHPMAWVLARQVRRDGEKACDDLVLRAGTKPSVYAGHLLGIFRSLTSAAHPVAPAVASARPSHFEGRLRSILDPKGPRRDFPRVKALASGAALIAAAAFLSAVAPWAPSGSETIADSQTSSKRVVKAARKEAASASSSCPTAKARAAKAAAVRASAGSGPATSHSESPSAPASHPVSDCPSKSAASPAAVPETDSGEPLPESGKTVPAILKTLEKVKDAATFVRASQRFTKAGKHEGSDWYGHAMELHNDGRYEEAIAAFEKSIDAGFREDASSYNIACGYARLGKRDQAFEWLHKAMDAGFDLRKYLGHDDDLDGLKADPRWRELKAATDQSSSRRAEREAAAAAARYERLVAKNPKDGEGFYNIGKELLDAGHFDLSAKAFAESAARGYRTPTALYNEACALSRGNQTRAALDTLQKALDAGFDQAGLFDKDDDLDNVRDDPRFAQIRKEAKDLALPGYGTDSAFKGISGRRAKWREAAQRFEQYAQANPQKARAWFNYGFASLAGDRPEAAVDGFKKALDLNYRKPTTMYNLACSYARLDQKDAAFDWLFKALDSGFDATGTLRGDEDLDNLRGDPRFRKALDIARARDNKFHDDNED